MSKPRLVSVITVTLNSSETLQSTLDSVQNQQGIAVEHIVKDGGSHDATLSIARSHPGPIRIFERDDIGIYDAMNQGFSEAVGDVICFLNSDDYFADANVLRDVVHAFETSKADIVYGDLEIIGENGQVIRLWRSGEIQSGLLKGQQLPHPAFFVRRQVLEKIDLPFDPNYRISADFKQQVLLINKLGAKTHYLARTLVKMRHGGESTRSLRAVVKGWMECARAYREVTGKSGWSFVFGKVARKLPQFRLGRG